MRKNILSGLELFKRTLAFAKPFKKWLLLIFLSILGITLCNALMSFCLSRVFDIVQKNGINPSYRNEALLFIIFAILINVVRISIAGFQQKIEVKHLDIKIPNYLNFQSTEKFFSFSNGQHANEHSGVKQSIVGNGISSIQNQINMVINQLFPATTQMVVALIVLMYASLWIGILFIFSGIIFCLMMINHNNKIIPGIRKMRDQRQSNSRLISELYRLVSLIKNENQEEKSLEDLSSAQQKHQDIFVDTWIPGANRIQTVRWVANNLNWGIRFLAVFLLFEGSVTAGAIFLIFSYSTNFNDALWQLTSIHKNFLMDKINIERYFELLEVTPDIKIVENPIHPKKFFGEIEFKNVCFQYQKRIADHSENSDDLQENMVLNNISFKVKPGEQIGIVGESGSGKSTLASLLCRNFDPQNGQILIDGHDLRLLDLSWLLQNVGIVTQDVELFDKSIKDNILFGLKEEEAKKITKSRLDAIAKMTRIDGFFERLEHGYDTIVGEKGVKLSGGERQRVGIARAIAKNPSILIFDEATSALDSMSEKIVKESIDDVSIGKTSIIIAHRLSTVINCHRILVFRNGIMIGQGTHETLMSTCEYYSELVSHQMMV